MASLEYDVDVLLIFGVRSIIIVHLQGELAFLCSMVGEAAKGFPIGKTCTSNAGFDCG